LINSQKYSTAQQKVLEYKKSYLQQEQNDSPESPGPQQSTPRLASPPPAAASPAGSGQHYQRPQDSLVNPQLACLKKYRDIS
jgi:hypothetical protein